MPTFQVGAADPALARDVAAAIDAALHGAAAAAAKKRARWRVGREHTGLVRLDHRVVDELLQRDFARRATTRNAAYTVYLLLPHAHGHGHGYAYVDGEAEADRRAAFEAVAEDPLAGFEEGEDVEDEFDRDAPCPTGVWVGLERYLWIDLGAGPLAYGPEAGAGMVTAASALNAFHAGEASSRNPSGRQVAAKAATALHAACAQLLAPALPLAPPAAAWRTTKVTVLRVYDGPRSLDTGVDRAGLAEQLSLVRLLAEGEGVEVQVADVAMGDCALCASAFAHGLRATAYGTTGGRFRSLDSRATHSWLRTAYTEILGEAGLGGEDADRRRVVFLYDVAGPAPLLLDGTEQAVAFPDLVLAVRTRDSAHYEQEYACSHGEPLLDPSDLTRAVLGAVLESVWGVPKTHERAASARRDFAFSAARTPFGALSRSARLTFAQVDAAAVARVHGELLHRTARAPLTPALAAAVLDTKAALGRRDFAEAGAGLAAAQAAAEAAETSPSGDQFGQPLKAQLVCGEARYEQAPGLLGLGALALLVLAAVWAVPATSLPGGRRKARGGRERLPVSSSSRSETHKTV